MTKTGWIAVAVGVVGAGALILFKLGKRAAIPSPYLDSQVSAGGPDTAKIAAQAETAALVAAQAADQYTSLSAEKAQLEQKAYSVENALNAAIADQTPAGMAQAQALDVERQSLLTQLDTNASAITQTISTAEAAQQSLNNAEQALATAQEREQTLAAAQANAEAERQAREAEIARQAAAAAALNPAPDSAFHPKALEASIDKAIPLTSSVPKPGSSNYDKWRAAAALLTQLWMNDYSKQTTDQARLAWFKKAEAGITATERLAPGFGVWLAQNQKALLAKMTEEKKKVSASNVPADPKLLVWKAASVMTLDYWTKTYPGQDDKAKALGLINIVKITETTEKNAPGYMKWFEATYPGVSAKMMAEGQRLRNVSVPGSGALTEKPQAPRANTVELLDKAQLKSPVTKAAAAAARPVAPVKPVTVAPRVIVPTAGGGVKARPFVKEPAKVAPVKIVADNLAKAQSLRNTAKILTASTTQQAKTNVKLQSMLGR